MSDKALSSLNSGVPVACDTGDLLAAVVNGNSRATHVGQVFGSSTLFKQAGTGAVSRTIQSKMRERFSLFDFIPVALQSAISDETSTAEVVTYIQDALDAAKAEAKPLYCNPGRYTIEDLLEIDSGVEIYAPHRLTTFLAVSDLENRIMTNANHVGGNSDITIRGIIFDHNGLSQTGQNEPLRLVNVTGAVIEKNLFKRAAWSHLTLSDCTSCRVIRNEMTGGHGHGVVVRTGSEDNWVQDNYIHALGGADGHDFGSGAVFGYGIFLYDGNNLRNIVRANRIVNPNGHGIFFGGDGTNENYDDNRILFNTIISAGAINTSNSHHGIWISGDAKRNQIAGNVVNLSSLTGIKLNDEAHENTIRDNRVAFSGAHGMQIDDAEGNLIEANYVRNSGQNTTNTFDGINIATFGTSQKYNTIRGNHCYDDQASPTQRYGIRENSDAGDSDFNIIENNHCWNNVSGPILKSAANTIFRSNLLRNDSGVVLGAVTATGDATLLAFQKVALINLSAPATLTLPTAANVPEDYELLVIDIGGNLATHNLTISPSSGFTINGTTSFVMNQNGQRALIRKAFGSLRFVALDTGYLTPAAAAAAYQPLDSDLTSIAALTTQTFGRGLLEQASAQAACVTLRTPYVLATSAVASAVSATTDEEAMVTVSVPAGAMGTNGLLRITFTYTCTNGADDKIIRVRLGGLAGTEFNVFTVTATAGGRFQLEIQNVNDAAVQKAWVNSSLGWNTSTNATRTGTVDTTQAQDLVITGTKETSGDTLQLEKYTVELLRAA